MSEEHIYRFKGTLGEFLDAAYKRTVPTPQAKHPVTGPPDEPAEDIEELLANVRVGINQFGEDAFVILLSPRDFARAEMLFVEFAGVEQVVNRRGDEALTFCGRLVQQAYFVDEGRYIVIDRLTYEQIIQQSAIDGPPST